MRATIENNPPPASARQSFTSLATFLSLLTFVLGISIWMTVPYLLAILIGGILALFSYPYYKMLRQKVTNPTAASALITLALVLLVIGPLSLILNLALQQSAVIGTALAESEGLTVESVQPRINRLSSLVGISVTRRDLNNMVKSLGKTVSVAVINAAKTIPQTFLQIILATVACLFFLRDGRTFLKWMFDRLPLDEDIQTYLMKSFYSSAVSSIWASMSAALVQAAIMMLGFWMLKIPGVFFAGGITFLFSWIPLLGIFPAWLGGMAYLYLQEYYSKMALMLILGMLAGIADNIVRALVLKGRDAIHPLVSLVAIFGGIQIFGIVGVLVGPVIIAILISFLQIWPAVGRRSGLDLGGEASVR